MFSDLYRTFQLYEGCNSKKVIIINDKVIMMIMVTILVIIVIIIVMNKLINLNFVLRYH